jgi:hypothetical protein
LNEVNFADYPADCADLDVWRISSVPYSRGWGYYPSGGLGLILIILLLMRGT